MNQASNWWSARHIKYCFIVVWLLAWFGAWTQDIPQPQSDWRKQQVWLTKSDDPKSDRQQLKVRGAASIDHLELSFGADPQINLRKFLKKFKNLKSIKLQNVPNEQAFEQLFQGLSQQQQLEFLEIEGGFYDQLIIEQGILQQSGKLHGFDSLAWEIERSWMHEPFDMPASLGLLTQLKSLRIYVNYDIKSLPQEIGQLQNLQYFEFIVDSLSPLREFPTQLSTLDQVSTASLISYSPHFKAIPKTFSSLRGLKLFFLFAPFATTLEASSSGYAKLETLSIDACAFQTFPPCILNMSKLQYLDMPLGQIEEIPAAFFSLKELRGIQFTHCYHLRSFQTPSDGVTLSKLNSAYVYNAPVLESFGGRGFGPIETLQLSGLSPQFVRAQLWSEILQFDQLKRLQMNERSFDYDFRGTLHVHPSLRSMYLLEDRNQSFSYWKDRSTLFQALKKEFGPNFFVRGPYNRH